MLWYVLALVVGGGIVALDLALGEAVLVGLLFVGPLVASTRTSPRATASLAALAVAVAGAITLAGGDPGGTEEVAGFVSAVVGSALAVWISALRWSREAATRRLRAQHSVARVGAESRTLVEAAPRMLRSIAETLHWDLGALWEVDEAEGCLRLVSTWSGPDVSLEAFERLSSQTTFAAGVGLPGRVWESGMPAWIVDVTDDPNFPRAPGALAAGLRSAFAFPLRARDEVLGAMEFFTRERRRPDGDLLRMMETFGSQVGTYVEVKRAEQAVHDSEALKTGILDAALDSVITIDSGGHVVEFNPAAEETFGIAREDAIGREMAELIVPEDLRDAHRAGLARFRREGTARILDRRLELRAVRADGREFPVEVTISQIPGSNPPLFTGYLRDITERVRAAEELRRSRDELETILGHLADGVTVQDAGGQVVYANRAAAELLGLDSVDELLRNPAEQLIERFSPTYADGRPIRAGDLPGARALEGEDPAEALLRYLMPATGDERFVLVKASPVRDAGGEVVLAVSVFEDVTAQRRSEASQRFLAEASRVLGASLDYEATLASVAELAVREIADWCAVDVIGPDGALERVALVHSDPAKLQRGEELRDRYPPQPDAAAGAPNVVRTGEPELYPEITDELLVQSAEDENHLRLMRELGLRSAIVVPLPGLDGPLGAMTFVSAESPRSYDDNDLLLALELARRAATAIENARIFGARAHIAQTLQRSLLPPRLPEIPGLQLAARYRAAGEGGDVGGDFYDAYELEEGRWAIAIGDVCGKGAEAAAVTALVRYTLRALAMHERSPVHILELLNSALLRQRNDRQFCTLVYAHVDTTGQAPVLDFACAGHPPPLLVTADGAVDPAADSGTLLGVLDDPRIASTRLRLDPGAMLILYTDGVTEARVGDRLLGHDGLSKAASAVAGLEATDAAERIEAAAAQAGEGVLRDDLAVLVVRAAEAASPADAAPALSDHGSDIEVRLPASDAAVAHARRALAPLADDLGGRAFDDLRLMVSELVTNGLRHAGVRSADWIGLTISRTATGLRVQVSDPGPGFSYERHRAVASVAAAGGHAGALRGPGRDAGSSEPGGWGLFLVEQLADRWGINRGERTTVWLEVDYTGAR